MERRAYHEAGHAVAAAALGRIVELVTIVPYGKRRGACRTRRAPTSEALEDAVVVTYAGMYADYLCCIALSGRDLTDVELDSVVDDAGGDLDKARRVRGLATVVGAPEDDTRIGRRTVQILDERWPAVEALAAALLKRRRLSGSAARRIIRGAGGVRKDARELGGGGQTR